MEQKGDQHIQRIMRYLGGQKEIMHEKGFREKGKVYINSKQHYFY